jgi:hypothetical protein
MNAHSDISTLRIEFEQTLINQERKSNRANFHYEKKYKKHIERERERERERTSFELKVNFVLKSKESGTKTMRNIKVNVNKIK